MQTIAAFFDSVLGGLSLVGVSLVIGSVVWALYVLGAWAGRAPPAAARRCATLLAFGALGLALCLATYLTLKGLVLSETLGAGAMRAFTDTAHFRAGASRALLALIIAAIAWRIRPSPARRCGWIAIALLALPLAASGVWFTHAVGRLESRGMLMALTVLHQLSAAVWVGGLIQLIGCWRLARRDSEVDRVWRDTVRRFSRVALLSVLGLVVTALPLAGVYVGSWDGLVGTGHGSLVLAKSLLMGAALLLAAFSFRAARSRGDAGAGRRHLPPVVEGEAILAVMVLFTAAALSQQPPAVDQSAERASWREVVEVFRPKWPSLRTPSVGAMEADRTPRTATTGARSREAYLWSNFSHNVAGLILLAMSLLALAELAGGARSRPYWTLGFGALAVFIFLRAAANEGTWPFGAVSIGRMGPESVQHRVAALLVLGLGVMEWRVRGSAGSRPRLAYCLPVLAAAGGLLLLTHSHATFEPKSVYLVQVTHTAMGGLAALMAAARWLELRLAPPASRVAGAASAVAMLLVALVLVFYREANVVLP
jgi:putative copper resistance protein D